MKAISYTAARENLASTMSEVCEDHVPVIITRKRNQSVVMLSLEDYDSLQGQPTFCDRLRMLRDCPKVSLSWRKGRG